MKTINVEDTAKKTFDSHLLKYQAQVEARVSQSDFLVKLIERWDE